MKPTLPDSEIEDKKFGNSPVIRRPPVVDKKLFIPAVQNDNKKTSSKHTVQYGKLDGVSGFLKKTFSHNNDNGLREAVFEVVASELARYFEPHQPHVCLVAETIKTRMDKDPDTVYQYYVFSQEIEFMDFAACLEKKMTCSEWIRSGIIRGFGKITVLNKLLMENDAHLGNMGIVPLQSVEDKKVSGPADSSPSSLIWQVVELDRGQCLNPLLHFVPGRCYQPTSRDMKLSPFCLDFHPNNFADQIDRGQIRTQSALFPNQLHMNNLFKEEENETLLDIALCPDLVFETIIEKTIGSRSHPLYFELTNLLLAPNGQRHHLIAAALGYSSSALSFRDYCENHLNEVFNRTENQLRTFRLYNNEPLFEDYIIAVKQIQNRIQYLTQLLQKPIEPIQSKLFAPLTLAPSIEINPLVTQQRPHHCCYLSRLQWISLTSGGVIGFLFPLTIFLGLSNKVQDIEGPSNICAAVFSEIGSTLLFAFIGFYLADKYEQHKKASRNISLSMITTAEGSPVERKETALIPK